MVAPFPTHVPSEAVAPPVRRPIVAAFRALTALAAATGVVIELSLGSPPQVLSYFTIQSNILLALVLAVAARRSWKPRRPVRPLITGGVLLLTAITGLVYHLLLTNTASGFSMTDTGRGSTWETAATQLLHTVTPIAAVLDWLLFTRPGALRIRHAGLWMAYPALYLAFTLLRGAALSPGTRARYPYPFLDAEVHGYATVALNAAVLGASFYALALVLVGLDRVRPIL
ncbi:Pr6Pr family membrane protein [Streptomyces tsukubensis]|uniref:Integral membrane regulator n=1 Tax=Streptomyces tsukubensis TaxID=83656 RepID=A0A1V4ABX2_9ACTN|nr:Pr6Pr family membrane protein [Streptomyces tsukubensis]OON81022.1 integral membrane regulator [Streptomyces tsukubensis]QFR94859.1 integral membrane regulator [Streptomyces tsukubensis]